MWTGTSSKFRSLSSKSFYPTYAVTPFNLVPSCRDCNFIKNDAKFNKDTDAPIHPYYDDVNSIVWLKVRLLSQDGDLIPVFLCR